MSGDVLIRVEGVSKKFTRSLRQSMRYGITDIARDFVGLPTSSDGLRPGEFWAVDDLSFGVRRGECLGLIGPNGAGKSTLLKLLNGIIMPDKGHIEVRGRAGALIEIGAGFHPMLTGRENVYVNGTILGLNKRTIDKLFDSIVEFSELKDFIDTPVKFYSSGMYVRLGFAIAAQMDPDVLLIDEVLAVGDVGFRAKCYRFIAEVIGKAAVIFISHSMPAVAKICDRILVVNGGRCVFEGETARGIDRYYHLFAQQETMVLGTGEAQIEGIRLLNASYQETEVCQYGQPLVISFHVRVSGGYDNFLVSITFASQEAQFVAQCHSAHNCVKLRNDSTPKHIEVTIPKLLLNPGHYTLDILVYDKTNTRQLAWHHSAKRVCVEGDFVGSGPIQWDGEWVVRGS